MPLPGPQFTLGKDKRGEHRQVRATRRMYYLRVKGAHHFP